MVQAAAASTGSKTVNVSGIKKVAVIGAGSSGITAVKELLKKGFQVTAFEARDQVGGAWIYSSKPPPECEIAFDEFGRPIALSKNELRDALATSSTNGLNGKSDGDGVSEESNRLKDILLEPSPMYRLRTNIPNDLMSYRGFPFSHTSGPFPRDDEVLEYLHNYAADISQHIRFNTLVNSVHKANGKSRWTVESLQAGVQDPETNKEEFDAICDCSGHYTRPYIPYVNGLWRFKNRILHAKWYRRPEAFADKTILVVGNSASGYDIGREIATFFHEHKSTRKVYQSMRHLMEIGIDPSENPPWATNIVTVPAVAEVVSDTQVKFVDGQVVNFDLIIFATGYLYSLPYYKSTEPPFTQHPLTKTPILPSQVGDADFKERLSGQPLVEYPSGGLQIFNLDKDFQTFYFPDPTLSFLALNKNVIPFPLAQAQSHVVAKVWAGTPIVLQADPTTEENPTFHKYGAPKEFDVTDAFLQAVGEGQPPADAKDPDAHSTDLENDQDSIDAEIAPDGTFPATSRWRREKRQTAKAFRRKTLGY